MGQAVLAVRRRPFSAYPNDPSFRLAVPEAFFMSISILKWSQAGIPERPFLFSTRVSQLGKQFARLPSAATCIWQFKGENLDRNLHRS